MLENIKASLQKFSKFTDPGWRRKRIHHRINGPIQYKIHGPGIDYAGGDWDTLIILDACRGDLFEEFANLNRWDEYERVKSGCGATRTWFERKWNREYGDIVYVSGTPVLSRCAPGSFHRVVECWQSAINEELNAPDPEIVTDSAIEAHEEYPNKRVVVHYIQPHYPFVQDTDLHFTEFAGTEQWDVNADSRATDVWEALRAGIVDKDKVWDAYGRNLEYVLDEVDELLDTIEGRVVLSSDHGNLLGEITYPIPFREYGHPMHLAQPSLTTVPWAVNDGPRREVIEEEVGSTSDASSGEIESHLQALGYMDE
ncbi:hypothetical protein [Halorubrum trueperi]|uniref:Uncharacterized protein n=1 Tax=Halorubrum trueperi TaxID=2004704 RepID=A0ABD5UR61_9EURY